jgi:FkbM family methyltransferase
MKLQKFFRKLGHSISKRVLWVPRRVLYAINGYATLGGLKLPLHEFSKESRALLLGGYYEEAEIEFVRKHIPRGAYVVEFGASIGVISCHILKQSPAFLLSFEAVGAWASLARKTVGLNFTNPPYELKEMAIGRKGQREVLFAFDSQENLGGQVVDSRGQEARRSIITVPALSLSEVNEIHRVPDDAWLVMDIEGAEWDLARCQGDALRKYEGIIVECHAIKHEGRDLTPQEIVEEFKKCGFRLVELVSHYTHVVAFLRRDDR